MASPQRQTPMAASRESEIEFRPDAPAPIRLAETLIAFANAAGGTLLLGVDPRTGQPAGLADPDAALDRALQAALAADPPLILPLPQLVERDGQPVLVVSVPPGLPHVYSVNGKYLIRDGSRNRPLKPNELHRLMMQRGAASFEATLPPGATADARDWPLLRRYLAGLPAPATLFRPGARPALHSPEEALLSRRCLVQEGGTLRPTVAGLLLFGRDPQRFVPSAEILAARYAGTAMADTFLKEEMRGTLPELIRRAEAFVAANQRRTARLAGLERVEEPEVPLQAVREAIVNAVAHRDYQLRGDEIRIFLFSDRLEVYSPGRLPGHVTLDNLVQERFSRNEVIVQVLSDLGFIERLGYGIDRMLRQMQDAGLPAPTFEETAAGFRVTLHGRGGELPGLATDVGRWRRLGLNERQEVALAYLSEHGRITSREYQELCPDVSAETIRRDLADLVSRGQLLKIGDKRATYYIFK